MKIVWKEIQKLIDMNSRHRKGFYFAEISQDFILAHGQEELSELIEEPNDIDEMGDLFGVLINYCCRMGWTMEDIEESIVKKLKMRFDYENHSSRLTNLHG